MVLSDVTMTAWLRATARATPWLLLIVVGYGALLRFEAFHRAYGPLAGGPRLLAVQQTAADLAAHVRPSSIDWPRASMPYRHDAKSYLDSARAMEHFYDFYEARLREPLFVFSTKVGLWLTGGQDIAVSLVSSIFGLLLVPATYVLGRSLGGVVVGLLAALLVAIEPQLIETGVRGYRDDLFSLLTVLFALACLGLYRRPSWTTAVLAGTIGAGACLTRITALTLVLPGLAAVVACGGRARRRETAGPAVVAGGLVALLIAPFLVNCWITFGDPLYAIDWHSAFYERRSNVEKTGEPGAVDFLWRQFAAAPLVTIDSALRGVTHHPWANKWTELGRHWGGALASALKWLCLAGLLMWLWFTEGRLVLAVLAGSMVPFVFTWEAFTAWRFTQHTYPFYMAAAAFAAVRPIRWGIALARNGHSWWADLRGVFGRALLTMGVVLSFFAVVALLPPLIVYQQLTHGQAASVGGDQRTIFMLPREAFFFAGNGWSGPQTEGNITFHEPGGERGRLRVPMSANYAYRCLVRLEPMPPGGGPGVVELRLNEWSGRMSLERVPDGLPRYWVTIPQGVAKTGVNRLELVAPGRSGPAFRFWFVRFFPLSPDVRTNDGR